MPGVRLAAMSDAGKYFSRRSGLRDFIEAGPHADVLNVLARGLESRGYAPGTITGYLRGGRHVTWCIEHRRLRRAQLTLDHLRAFARGLPETCGCPHCERPTANAFSAMKALLPILQEAGLAAAPEESPYALELNRFDEYLSEVRGLADDTRVWRRRALEGVLRVLMPKGHFDARRLTAAAVNGLVLRAVEEGHLTKAKVVADSLRVFCRYLLATGRGAPFDVKAIHAPKSCQYRPRAKALTKAQLRMLLRPLREKSALAARDFAVLLLLGRTGLRRSDVARAQLADFDARASTLHVRRNKSRVGHEMPLPPEVKDAILDYVCRYRRTTKCQALFLAENFPYDAPVSPGAVGAIVGRAFERAGLEHGSKGAHVLRHTLATHLVSERAPLKVIADVLVHKSIETTARYARIDLDRMKQVARPWAGCQRAH